MHYYIATIDSLTSDSVSKLNLQKYIAQSCDQLNLNSLQSALLPIIFGLCGTK